ncbi:lysoplasmalogenase [Mycolicibacterium sp. CH28]|uniref:lysoplasmalogenase n=1 Tax=Mycolicibacterium sp. CH28 TaxID=2512237 RepID=UPI0010802148|nr:lysoplasmalogenase [Mycolicibacterium sp. CH28]TGD90374.1 lysoplasmalogenase [Mycolicibacterium sp. CH28]
MASTGGLSKLGISPPYLRTPTTWWLAGVVAAVGYGIFLVITALRLPDGAELTGRFTGQPVVKALMAVLLAVAALWHPLVRERRWLVAALLFSAGGDFFLAMPWWQPSFVLGLGSFLLAHLCYLGALLPLRGQGGPRLLAAAALIAACVGLLIWFWPRLVADGLTVPVTIYMAVLAAMVCAALLAVLPTPWTALGAVVFAISDGMIGIGRFILDSSALEVPIWWVYATSQVLITAGFFFGRAPAADR